MFIPLLFYCLRALFCISFFCYLIVLQVAIPRRSVHGWKPLFYIFLTWLRKPITCAAAKFLSFCHFTTNHFAVPVFLFSSFWKVATWVFWLLSPLLNYNVNSLFSTFARVITKRENILSLILFVLFKSVEAIQFKKIYVLCFVLWV